MESGFHKQPPNTVMNQPSVARIRVEYEDGSCDTIERVQRDDFPLYCLTRKRPGSELPRGAYTNAAIAALLFSTAFTTKWTEYSSRDKKMGGLICCWGGESQPQTQDSGQTGGTQ